MGNTIRERQQIMNAYPLETRFAFRKHMIINREFEQLLKQNGLDDFDTIMRLHDVEIVKQKIKERSTVRFQIPHGDGTDLIYLKRYRYAMIPSFLKNCLSFSKTYSAIHEWRNILAFKAANLPTMNPIAVGMRRSVPFWNESFLLTQGIPHVKTLEKTAQEDFIPPSGKAHRKQKRALIERLATLTRRMHDAGFKHQDFYLCHLLINWSNPDDPLLYIADLHRVRRQRKNKGRWRIKDLAALNYSAPTKTVSRADRLRFLTAYDPMLAKDRSFVMAIMSKTERIRSHTEKKGD
jgi:heptose I phosphotransferase